jgi:uncharacterized protein YllA (UPF0747 family)
LDYVEGAQPARAFFPCRPDAAGLRSRAGSSQAQLLPRQHLCNLLIEQANQFWQGEPALHNIAKLRDPQTVAVVAALRPGLFGGPLCSWLKALTAARLADWLTQIGMPAVSIGWIDSKIERAELSVGLLSPEGPQHLALDGLSVSESRISNAVSDLLKQAARALEASVAESDVLKLLESAYAPGTELALAWGRSISKMLEPCGMILVDPLQPDFLPQTLRLPTFVDRRRISTVLEEQERRLGAAGYGPTAERSGRIGRGAETENQGGQPFPSIIMQNLILPVAATVMEEAEAFGFALDHVIFTELGLQPQLYWPRVSATLLDARSRKVLSRSGLRLAELYVGRDVVTERLMGKWPVPVLETHIDGLKAKIDWSLTELSGLVPPGDKLSRGIENSRRRMVFQVEKLRMGFFGAQRRRQEANARQVSRLCNGLAPWGRLQEREFAGFQFIQRHSSALSRILYEKIDPWKFEHQLIFL